MIVMDLVRTGVVWVRDDLVGDSLLLGQDFLQGDDEGENQSNLSDQEGFTGNQSDTTKDEGEESGEFHFQQKQNWHHVLTLLLFLESTTSVSTTSMFASLFIIFIIINSSSSSAQSVHHIHSLQVNLQSMGGEEVFNLGSDHSVNVSSDWHGTRCTISIVGNGQSFHNSYSFEQVDVVLGQHFVNKGEQFEFQARVGPLVDAVAVDVLHHFLLGRADGVGVVQPLYRDIQSGVRCRGT
uniref:Uncharacterized protein n=1 Tax=Cacopsylla melanoneura TaxID=428564 RepID=A0A8D8X834_9HEMI